MFDKSRLARCFSEAAASYDDAAVLYREVGTRMLERLEYIKLAPSRILDLGANTGYFARELTKRFPKAQVYGIDIAFGMLRYAKQQKRWFARERYIGADADCLPFPDQSMDLIFSDLVLQWSPHLANTLAEVRRVLHPQGVFIFSTYGPDTLQELRASFAAHDTLPHVHDFIDMHDIGDVLQHGQWADPVVEMEKIVLRYQDVYALCCELKALGVQNHAANRRMTLTGKQRFAHMISHYERYRRDGKLPATFEIIYAMAWGAGYKPMQAQMKNGEILIDVKSIGRAN